MALLAVGGATALVRLIGLNSTTAGLVLLVVVLGIALARGLRAAVIGAFAATLAFNFFFLPPPSHFHDRRARELGRALLLPDRGGRREPARPPGARAGR
ncbi:MAG: DUF4118 domain-containing protein [Holophagales bacterium]|nr:DUF4118 domain-containing protein [Holophagales bacterium]